MTNAGASYKFKQHAFKPEKLWTLESDGLRWADQDEEAKSGFLPFDSIKSVRLRFEPSRAETRRVGLHIYAPYAHYISNIDYQGPLNFKLQKDAFRDFVLAFHAAIPADSKTVFHKGSTMGAFIGNLTITAFVLLLLLFIAPLVSITGIPGGTSIFRIVMILIFLPILFKMLKTNKPGNYRPDDVPMEFLEIG